MLATANTGKIGRGLEKNAGEWTRRVEIGKEEIPAALQKGVDCALQKAVKNTGRRVCFWAVP